MNDEFEKWKSLADTAFDRALKKCNGRVVFEGASDEDTTEAEIIRLDCLAQDEKCVVLTFHVLGLAGGMGLDEMLDGEMDSDPGYLQTIAAFREIGANEMADILEEGIARKTAIAVGADTSKLRDFDSLDEEFYSRERDCVLQIGRYVLANGLN